jgi:glycosyltransferase involved in cell wall biosynthesis
VLGLLSKLPAGQAALAALDGSPVAERAHTLGLEVHTVGKNKADPRIVGRLVRLIRRGGFQVVDTQNPQAKLWGSLAAVQAKVALVSTLNSWYESEHGGSLKGHLYQTLERVSRREADMFIAVSPDIRHRLLASGIPEEAVALILNAVDIEPATILSDRDRLCREFDLPEGAYICCAVGRLVEAKGFSYLIAGFKRLTETYPDLYCLIVGEGYLYKRLAELIAQLGLETRVRLLGFREHEQTLAIVKACDLFVMPSLSEGTPVSLLEAASMGLPIVATHVGGIPALLTHEQEGLLVEPASQEALITAIAYLHDHPETASRLGAQARQRVIRDFSLSEQAKATQNVYRLAWERCQQYHQRR